MAQPSGKRKLAIVQWFEDWVDARVDRRISLAPNREKEILERVEELADSRTHIWDARDKLEKEYSETRAEVKNELRALAQQGYELRQDVQTLQSTVAAQAIRLNAFEAAEEQRIKEGQQPADIKSSQAKFPSVIGKRKARR